MATFGHAKIPSFDRGNNLFLDRLLRVTKADMLALQDERIQAHIKQPLK